MARNIVSPQKASLAQVVIKFRHKNLG